MDKDTFFIAKISPSSYATPVGVFQAGDELPVPQRDVVADLLAEYSKEYQRSVELRLNLFGSLVATSKKEYDQKLVQDLMKWELKQSRCNDLRQQITYKLHEALGGPLPIEIVDVLSGSPRILVKLESIVNNVTPIDVAYRSGFVNVFGDIINFATGFYGVDDSVAIRSRIKSEQITGLVNNPAIINLPTKNIPFRFNYVDEDDLSADKSEAGVEKLFNWSDHDGREIITLAMRGLQSLLSTNNRILTINKVVLPLITVLVGEDQTFIVNMSSAPPKDTEMHVLSRLFSVKSEENKLNRIKYYLSLQYGPLVRVGAEFDPSEGSNAHPIGITLSFAFKSEKHQTIAFGGRSWQIVESEKSATLKLYGQFSNELPVADSARAKQNLNHIWS